MELRPPQNHEEFENYYHVRWVTLREPWGKPVGSERLEDDDDALHLMVVDDEEIVGVARGHFNSPEEGQIRLMGVLQQYRGRDIGRLLLREMERMLSDAGAKYVVVQARDYAMGFYEKNGYEVVEKAYLMWDKIQHFKMRRDL